jgi:Domain of unknown function (DUF4194)
MDSDLNIEDSEDLVIPDLKEGEALFHGDTGQLAFSARRVLSLLLQGPSLEARRHRLLWPMLLQHEDVVRSRLAEVFLELVVDREQEAAFTRPAETGDLEVPRLLRSKQLRFLDSVLLLHLRGQLVQAASQGDRAVVSFQEMQDHLLLYKKTSTTDHAMFVKHVASAIDKMKDLNILHKLRNSEDRFEVSATLKLLFPVETVQALGAVYQELLVQDAKVDDNAESENAA